MPLGQVLVAAPQAHHVVGELELREAGGELKRDAQRGRDAAEEIVLRGHPDGLEHGRAVRVREGQVAMPDGIGRGAHNPLTNSV